MADTSTEDGLGDTLSGLLLKRILTNKFNRGKNRAWSREHGGRQLADCRNKLDTKNSFDRLRTSRN
jgi:hypothetical protein